MLELVRIEQQSIKQKWQRRFAKYHDQDVKEWGSKLSRQDLSVQDVRCYVAIESRRENGFIRIHDKSKFFARYTDAAVWNLTEAFVKPSRRHNGILREMITLAVRDLDVKMISIPTDGFGRYKDYYLSLGFTCFHPAQNGDITWAFVSGFAAVAKMHHGEAAGFSGLKAHKTFVPSRDDRSAMKAFGQACALE